MPWIALVPRSLPPLTWIRAFESSARHLSFTRAAHELNLTQSAISQHVRSLEDRFGCALFVRKHRGLDLTDQGRRLIPPVTAAVAALTQAAATFDTNQEKQMLTISASLSISRWYIVPYLKTFTDRHEDVTVRLSTKTWPDEFFGSDADVEIRFDSKKSAGDDAILLAPNKMVVVAPPTYAGRSRGSSLTPAEIAAHRLVGVVGTADSWQAWATRNDIKEELNISAYVESHANAVDLARAGAGIAYTNYLIAAPSLADGSLVLLDNEPDAAQDGYYLHVKDSRNHAIAQEFSTWIQLNIARFTEYQGV
jgi:LysR family glycine cleavage system transcriptional activator